MVHETQEIIVGFDLGYEYSQLTFYGRNNTEPLTLSLVQGEKQYRLPTPKDLFALVEQRADSGVLLLSGFFEECFHLLAGNESIQNIAIMVTMKMMKGVWARAITEALERLGIDRKKIYLQGHLESFYYYLLNQKQELWRVGSVLLEYERESIVGYELSIDYHTKPAIVRIQQSFHLYLDAKAQGNLEGQAWNQEKDQLLLHQCQKMLRDKKLTSVFLVGEQFGQEWMQRSLQFICQQRHVFQGGNLYTKGACYGAMKQHKNLPIGNFLFIGKDLVKQNINIPVMEKGQERHHTLVSAGLNWYMVRQACEILIDDKPEIILYSRSMNGEEMVHTIALTDLPARPKRATRIRMEIVFTASDECHVYLEDLGLGSLYPTSGKKWESVLKFDNTYE